jgi:ribonuclease P protein component
MRDAGDATGQPIERAMQPGSCPVDAGLPRERRRVRSADYQRVFSHEQRRAGGFLVLWTARGPCEVPRVGVIASKRTFRRAVDRARAKRLLRESFRLNRDQWCPYTDCVLVARRAILNARCSDVERDLLDVARRCRVLRRSESGERL